MAQFVADLLALLIDDRRDGRAGWIVLILIVLIVAGIFWYALS